MTNQVFSCPVCKEFLTIAGNSLKCKNNHSFDISKRGYVNLLLSKHNTNHGDDKNMVLSRRDFLNLGYYSKLANVVSGKVEQYAFSNCCILDLGCGEGYYTSHIKENLDKKCINGTVLGIDISKTALDYACRRNPGINYAVASAFDLPIPTDSVDIVVNIFAPHDIGEIGRVLKNNGILIMVLPQKKHLWELKEIVYDKPYENESPVPDFGNYSLSEDEELTYKINLSSNDEIANLFAMTPYVYNTSIEDKEKLNSINELTVTADFRIAVFKNKK